MIELPTNENLVFFGKIKKLFIKSIVDIIFELFFAKLIGYQIPELGGKIMWFRIIEPCFNDNIEKFRKRNIQIVKFNDEKIVSEYSAIYIQINFFYFWHMRDYLFNDYICLLETNREKLELVLANEVKKKMIYKFVISLRNFFLISFFTRGGEKLFICTKCRKKFEKTDFTNRCPKCGGFVIREDMISLWDHI